MDYHEVIARYFSKALESEYGIESERLVFKSVNKNSLDAYLDGDLIFNVVYSVVEYSTTTVCLSIKTQAYNKIPQSICSIEVDKDLRYGEFFEEYFVKMLREIDLDINKETIVVNNAQEIIEITKKAKEENIKKDIADIELKILEAARNGNERLLFSLSELKTDVSLMNKYDNEIVRHFKNKGFECSMHDGIHLGSYLKISWGD